MLGIVVLPVHGFILCTQNPSFLYLYLLKFLLCSVYQVISKWLFFLYMPCKFSHVMAKEVTEVNTKQTTGETQFHFLIGLSHGQWKITHWIVKINWSQHAQTVWRGLHKWVNQSSCQSCFHKKEFSLLSLKPSTQMEPQVFPTSLPFCIPNWLSPLSFTSLLDWWSTLS